MKREIKFGIFAYALADFLSSSLGWLLFLYYRKNAGEPIGFMAFFEGLSLKDLWLILLLIPFFWLVIHLFSGAYFNPYRKSRFIEIYRTLISSIIGTIFLYFIFFLNDDSADNTYYYKSFFVYLLIQFLCTSLGRIIVM